MNHTPYQLTPAASKGNAFCWMSWQSDLALSDGKPAKPLQENSKAGLMRQAMQAGPKWPAELAHVADVPHAYMVAALLKNDLASGRVVRRDGKYCLTLNGGDRNG